MLFAWMYYLLPSKWNHFRSAFYGALLASILWEISKLFFDYYVSHVARFLTIYGSFTSIAVMFLWVYYSAFVVLLGAEFGALLHETTSRGRSRKLCNSLGRIAFAAWELICCFNTKSPC